MMTSRKRMSFSNGMQHDAPVAITPGTALKR
jgi:hypothetical protein